MEEEEKQKNLDGRRFGMATREAGQGQWEGGMCVYYLPSAGI
jgi:hypothetical protein